MHFVRMAVFFLCFYLILIVLIYVKRFCVLFYTCSFDCFFLKKFALLLQVEFNGLLPNKDYVFDAEIAVFNYFMNKIEGNKHFFVKIYYLFQKKYLSLYTNKCLRYQILLTTDSQ